MERFKYKLVLIADDDTRNTFALCSSLGSLDMAVDVVENGEEALES